MAGNSFLHDIIHITIFVFTVCTRTKMSSAAQPNKQTTMSWYKREHNTHTHTICTIRFRIERHMFLHTQPSLPLTYSRNIYTSTYIFSKRRYSRHYILYYSLFILYNLPIYVAYKFSVFFFVLCSFSCCYCC